MNAILTEFNNVLNEIKAEQASMDFKKVLCKRKKFSIKKTSYAYGSLEINNAFRVTSKIMTRFIRHYKCTGAEVVNHLLSNQFYICSLPSVNIVWVETTLGMISFLQTSYLPTALSQWTPRGDSYQDALTRLITDDLHISLVALSYIVLPFGLQEFQHHEKCYLILRHLKSMIEIFKNTAHIFDDFVIRHPDKLIFDSKLLGRDYNPLIVETHLSPTGALVGINLVEGVDIKPLYAEPQMDLHDVSELDVCVDSVAEKHLRQKRFRDLIDLESVHMIDSLTLHSLQKSVYVKGIIVPLIYKGYAALGVRIYNESQEPVYSVGYFPTDGVFRIRTVMSPEVVHLNNKTLTSLYSSEELIKYGRPR